MDKNFCENAFLDFCHDLEKGFFSFLRIYNIGGYFLLLNIHTKKRGRNNMTVKNQAPKQKSSTTYRDTILRKLCQDETRAIELCNAVTGSNYSEDSKVLLCDLDSSLVWRYNDVAIAVEDELLFMVEHQSSISRNLPLRFLSYATDILYSWFVQTDKLYPNKLHKIPTPRFYVLYNGATPLKETKLKLSTAFEVEGGENSLELIVHIIDVNYTNGNEVLNKSNLLRGYSYLIEQIRDYMRQGLTRDKAIQASIKHCIENDVLSEFLKTYYEEVAKMLNLQYDQEAEFRALRQEAREEGLKEGREEGREQGIEQGREQGIEQGIEQEKLETARKLLAKGMSVENILEVTNLPLKTIENLKNRL